MNVTELEHGNPIVYGLVVALYAWFAIKVLHAILKPVLGSSRAKPRRKR